jgi:hypothetical protein
LPYCKGKSVDKAASSLGLTGILIVGIFELLFISFCHTIIRREMHNFYLLLNSNTTTTHIRIGSTVVYTLGLCALGPTRIFYFVASLLQRQLWKLRCRKHNRNAQFRHTMSHMAPRPIHDDTRSPTAHKANESPVFHIVRNFNNELKIKFH